MHIIPIAIPTPFYVGDVNVYLVKEDPLTLIDVGPKTDEAARILREKLGRNGVRLLDVRRIVLTHAHEDHCGLAKIVRDDCLRCALTANHRVYMINRGAFGKLSRTKDARYGGHRDPPHHGRAVRNPG